MSGSSSPPIYSPPSTTQQPTVQTQGSGGTGFFQPRAMSAVITIGQGAAFSGGGNSVTISGLRMEATIVPLGHPDAGHARVKIYGVTLDTMNTVSSLGCLAYSSKNNSIQINAGVAGQPLQSVFYGIMWECVINLVGQPESFLDITARAQGSGQLGPSADLSRNGQAKAVDLLSQLAQQQGFTFNNPNNDQTVLTNVYHSGSLMQQMTQVADAAGLQIVYDIRTNPTVVTVFPKYQSVAGNQIISPATGMVSYPIGSSQRIRVKTLFNPAILYGSTVEIQSSLQQANGPWRTFDITHEISCLTPGGPWFTELEGDITARTGSS